MIEVAAAIVVGEQGRVLLARRKQGKQQGGLWEFPGGKLEPGESAADCLRRELLEEMGIKIEPHTYFAVHEHDYGTVQIRLYAYMADYMDGVIELIDHDAHAWVAPSELMNYALAPADVPFAELLVRGG